MFIFNLHPPPQPPTNSPETPLHLRERGDVGMVEGLRARHNTGLLAHVQGQRPQHLWVQRSGMRWGSVWVDCKQAEGGV